MKASAIFFKGINQVVQGDITIPDPRPDEVLIETAYSCISPGTELRCLAGQQPGALPFPFVPGYAMSGRICAAGKDTSLPIGTPVFCSGTSAADQPLMWGGHVSHAVRKASEVIEIPAEVNLLDAAIIQIAGIALHGLRASQPQIHETVLVVGLGAIGQFAARLHALSGAHVLAADRVPERVKLAQESGVEAMLIEEVADLRAALPDGADILVDTTGVPAVLPTLIALARDIPWDDSLTPGSRYVIQGSYPADFHVPYQSAFAKELTFLIPRNVQPRDARTVLALMQRGKLSAQGIISQVYHPAACADAYAALQAGDHISAAFAWNS